MILRCLSREPRGRFARVEEVANALAGRVPAVSLDVTAATAPVITCRQSWTFSWGAKQSLRSWRGRFANGARLVTLVGTAGMGKTRIAVRYGRQHLVTWPGGVWFCDLTEARSLDGIVSAVARSLRPAQWGRCRHAARASDHGRGQCLVILDNFEQVVEHGRETVSSWLGRAMSARFLVTSRERLDLPGEGATSGRAAGVRYESRTLPGAGAAAAPRADARGTRARGGPGSSAARGGNAAGHRASGSSHAGDERREAPGGNAAAVPTAHGGSGLRHETLAAAIDGSWQLLRPWEMAAPCAELGFRWRLTWRPRGGDRSFGLARGALGGGRRAVARRQEPASECGSRREEPKDLAARDAVRDVREYSGVRTKEARRGRIRFERKGRSGRSALRGKTPWGLVCACGRRMQSRTRARGRCGAAMRLTGSLQLAGSLPPSRGIGRGENRRGDVQSRLGRTPSAGIIPSSGGSGAGGAGRTV